MRRTRSLEPLRIRDAAMAGPHNMDGTQAASLTETTTMPVRAALSTAALWLWRDMDAIPLTAT